MHLFLQGDIGIGKSSLLRQALKEQGLLPRGFVTQRLLKNGSIIGYRALVLDGETPPLQTEHSPGMEGVFLLKGQRNIDVLWEVLTQAEQKILSCPSPLLLLDEIGGMELTNSRFMEALLRILDCGIPCLGVFKSAANLAHTIKARQLDAEYERLHKNLAGLLEEQGELLTLSANNREEIRLRINSYLAMILAGQSNSST